MSSALDFTEEEVVEELRELGYRNISRDKLAEFMTDLKQLMRHHGSQSRVESDLSFASSASLSAAAAAADASANSDGLARYPHQTDFHWGRHPRHRGEPDDEVVDISAASTPRSAFEKSKVPLEDNSFYNESFFGQDRAAARKSQYRHNGDDRTTSPQRLVSDGRQRDDSVLSSASSSSYSLVMKRKISRRDGNGNRDVSTEELTYVEGGRDDGDDDDDDDDDDGATLVGDDNAIFEDEDDDGVNLTLSRRIVGRRPRSAESESSNASSTSSSASRALPSFIRPQPEPRRKRHDPVNRYHQYNEAWAAQRAPGEKQHKQLRWAVREQMQRREQIITPVQKYYVPNDFVPPTDKKRQNLRWEIRTKLAHKLNPSKNSPNSFNIWT